MTYRTTVDEESYNTIYKTGFGEIVAYKESGIQFCLSGSFLGYKFFNSEDMMCLVLFLSLDKLWYIGLFFFHCPKDLAYKLHCQKNLAYSFLCPKECQKQVLLPKL